MYGMRVRRELNTDASLNLQLEESTVRSERMTPFKYSTAHVKVRTGTAQCAARSAAQCTAQSAAQCTAQ